MEPVEILGMARSASGSPGRPKDGTLRVLAHPDELCPHCKMYKRVINGAIERQKARHRNRGLDLTWVPCCLSVFNFFAHLTACSSAPSTQSRTVKQEKGCCSTDAACTRCAEASATVWKASTSSLLHVQDNLKENKRVILTSAVIMRRQLPTLDPAFQH